jgi:hypothetical protein
VGKSADEVAREDGDGNAAAAAVLMGAGGTPAPLADAAGCFLEGRWGLASSVTAARGAQRFAMADGLDDARKES